MYITGGRGAQGISANGNREKSGRKNGNHSKTNGSRKRKLKYCQSQSRKFNLAGNGYCIYHLVEVTFEIFTFACSNQSFCKIIFVKLLKACQKVTTVEPLYSGHAL